MADSMKLDLAANAARDRVPAGFCDGRWQAATDESLHPASMSMARRYDSGPTNW